MVNILKSLLLSILFIFISSNVVANVGIASYYGKQFHGKRTASGEIYNMYALTAAHMSLPFGSKVRVTNLTNQKSVVVEINDRGAFDKYNRVIDLSKKANQMISCNLCKVDLKVLSRGDGAYKK